MHGARDVASDPVRLLAFYTAVYQAIECQIAALDDSDGIIGAAAAECGTGMLQTVVRTDVDGDSRRSWLEIAVPLYLEDDYGIGDHLHGAIAGCGNTREAGVAIDLLRGKLNEQLDASAEGDDDRRNDDRKTITSELIADLFRSSGRTREIDALFLHAGVTLPRPGQRRPTVWERTNERSG